MWVVVLESEASVVLAFLGENAGPTHCAVKQVLKKHAISDCFIFVLCMHAVGTFICGVGAKGKLKEHGNPFFGVQTHKKAPKSETPRKCLGCQTCPIRTSFDGGVPFLPPL